MTTEAPRILLLRQPGDGASPIHRASDDAFGDQSAYEFIDGVSHDFRTPLTVIKEYAGIMRDGLVGKVSREQGEILEVIDDRADDLAIMVDNMLDAAKRNAGLLSAWRRRVNVGDILRQVVPALARKAAIKRVGFEVAVDDDLPEVYCDPDEIGRVIVNLAAGAVKSSLAEDVIQVWARKGDDTSEVTIGVTGNGSGVAEDDVEWILDQLHRSDARAADGSRGLGLRIAKELVRLNLGRMDVASESGRGTTISFSVPVWNALGLAARCLDRFERSQPPIRQAALIVASVDSSLHQSLAVVIDEFLQSFFGGGEVAVQVEPCKWLVIAATGESEVGQLLDDARSAWDGSARTLSPDEWPAIELQARGVWPLDTERWRLLETYGRELALGPENNLDCPTSAR